MIRYISIYYSFISQYLKTLMQSRLNFLIGFLSFVINQVAGVVFLSIIFQKIPSLKGWSFDSLLFIYGFSQLPKGLDHLYSDNLWNFSQTIIVNGDFDKCLLRPLNPLFQVMVETLQLDALGEIIIGAIISVISINKLGINVNASFIIYLLLFIIISSWIITMVKLFFASLAFWIKNSYPLLNAIYTLLDFTRYPINIYSMSLKFILTAIIPFFVTTYYPAMALLGKSNSFYTLILIFVVAIVITFISYNVWLKGIKAYESAGN